MGLVVCLGGLLGCFVVWSDLLICRFAVFLVACIDSLIVMLRFGSCVCYLVYVCLDGWFGLLLGFVSCFEFEC